MLFVRGSIAFKVRLTMESHPFAAVNVYGPYEPPTVVVLPSGNVYVSPVQKSSVILFVTGLRPFNVRLTIESHPFAATKV